MLLVVTLAILNVVCSQDESVAHVDPVIRTLDSAKLLPGHLQPLGSHRDPEGPLEEVQGFPDAQIFFEKYVTGSKPVVFKDAAKKIPAYSKWTDEYLGSTYGDIIVEIEAGKKENRSELAFQISLQRFLSLYKRKNIYLVHDAPDAMQDDLSMPKSLQCGGFQKILDTAVIWFSSGGTKSVLHFDSIDNINCLFDGTKKLILFDKKYKEEIESAGWVHDASHSAIDVDKVDTEKYPQFSLLPYWSLEMQTGDCLYIPYGWYHQVTSSKSRNLAVNLWFSRLLWFDEQDCDDKTKPMNDVESLSKYQMSGMNIDGSLRYDLFEPFKHQNSVSLADVYNNKVWQDMFKEDVIEQVFKLFDMNSDAELEWSEIYNLSNRDLSIEYYPPENAKESENGFNDEL